MVGSDGGNSSGWISRKIPCDGERIYGGVLCDGWLFCSVCDKNNGLMLLREVVLACMCGTMRCDISIYGESIDNISSS